MFFVEMVIKISAYGLLFNKKAYLRSSWNIMDAIIVIVSVIDVLAQGDSEVMGPLKVLRIARILRPLRVIARNDNLKIVVRTIGHALPELRNLVVFSCLFFLIFGLLGVSQFKGQFYR